MPSDSANLTDEDAGIRVLAHLCTAASLLASLYGHEHS
jgi:hypothetical protein